MNHAAVSLLSTQTRAAIVKAAEELAGPSYPDLRGRADTLRARLAALIHAPSEGIALTRSTAHGFSILTRGLEWTAGENVVGARWDYPANVYPWMMLARQGVEFGEQSDLQHAGRLCSPLPASLFFSPVFSTG